MNAQHGSSAATSKTDLLIIGGGPAGYTAAIKASLQGLSVTLVERETIGGACINRGCIPTKALWGTAVSLQRLKDLKAHGITSTGKTSFDFATASKRQFAIMEHMVSTLRARMQKLGVKTMCAHARVSGRDTSGTHPFRIGLEPASKARVPREIRARFVLIATGSRPAESEVLRADHHLVLNTDDVMNLKELPKNIAIVGGGVVACEFASILNKFGCSVHLLEHSTQVLAAMDQEVVALLMQYFEEDGVKIHLQTSVAAVEKKSSSVRLRVTSKGKQTELGFDRVLLAIGRKPNSEDLGLEELGVKITPRGHVVVNERCETACPGLYAAGDVIGGQMLAHKAWYDAHIAIRSMCGEECATNYDTVPGAIFTIPEMAAVGLQPDQARQKGFKVGIGKFLYSDNAQAMCTGKTRGMVKAVIDRETGRVLGCTILGHDASNLISELALAVSRGLRVNDIAETIHPHPTLSEMVWEAFLDTEGRSIHKN